MEKVVIIIPENNKEKFISKGFSFAFKELAYFVIEKKICDLNFEEMNKILPNIIFVFWGKNFQEENLINFFKLYNKKGTVIIHCAELIKNIPSFIKENKHTYIFTLESKKNKYFHCINPSDYKSNFQGYKYSLTFCGNPAISCREKILADLVYNYGRINIFSRSYDFFKSLEDIRKNNLLSSDYIDLYRDSYIGHVNSTQELAQIYASSAINLDLENDNKNVFNFRCLQILASGGFLIAPDSKNLEKYFEVGSDLETFSSSEDLIDKINFYIKNLNIAQLIIEHGRKNVINNYYVYDKLKKMLKVIYGKNSCSR